MQPLPLCSSSLSVLACPRLPWAVKASLGCVSPFTPPPVPTQRPCPEGVRNASVTLRHRETVPSPKAVFNPLQNTYFQLIYTWVLLQSSISCIFSKLFSWEWEARFLQLQNKLPDGKLLYELLFKQTGKGFRSQRETQQR